MSEMGADARLLDVDSIETAYGRSKVLFGVSLTIAHGEMVTLMGRNGMGKTTTVRSIMGLTPASAGSIRLDGREIRALPSYRVAKLGVGLVPEGRQVFPNLTGRENLIATAANRRGAASPWTFDKVCALFPRLAERLDSMASLLSGGEQQMLAIGRALMTNPRLLILDEATEGLAPLIREEILALPRPIACGGSGRSGDRQEHRGADPPRRPPPPDRARPRGVDGDVGRAGRRARRAAPVSGDLKVSLPLPAQPRPRHALRYPLSPQAGRGDTPVRRRGGRRDGSRRGRRPWPAWQPACRSTSGSWPASGCTSR